MLSLRGWIVLATGVLLWIAARLVGSPDLHIVAVGVTLLPLAAGIFARWNRNRLEVHRRLSAAKVFPGQRIRVELEVRNQSPAPTSFIMLEDHVPAGLGRPARLVLTGLPAHNGQRVSYTAVCRARGRYQIGPLRLDMADPFALTRVRLEFRERDDLVVYPEVEALTGPAGSQFGSSSGDSPSRHLFRTGDEFYTMREYVLGDDLRRIHWPSVARRNRLMIRQDESARRSLATVLLDTRVSTFGQTYTPAFEKAVSVAATLGVHLSRGGFALRLAAGTPRPVSLNEDAFLEALASVAHTHSRPLSQMLLALRTSAVPDTTLAVVTSPPPAAEVAALTRVGTVFGTKLAVLVYPTDPAGLPPEPREKLETQATTARLSLARAGWDAYLIMPTGHLQDVWNVNRKKLPAATGS